MHEIKSHLLDSQKQLHSARGRTEAIIATADRMEKRAIRDARRLHIKLQKAENDEILQAEYFDALDRKKNAGLVSSMAYNTLSKLNLDRSVEAPV